MNRPIRSYKETAVDSLLKAIVRLSDKEALTIASLLEDSAAADSLSDLIQQHVKLRRLERRLLRGRNRRYATLTESQIVRNATEQATIDLATGEKISSSEIYSVVKSVFGNRDRFKSTIETIEGINTAFGISFDYENYKKDGRIKLFRDLRRRLESMSDIDREKRLKAFTLWLEKDRTSDTYYKRLVRILTGNG